MGSEPNKETEEYKALKSGTPIDEPVTVESYAEHVDKYLEEVTKSFGVAPRLLR